ncbi:unnamed protein product [Cuscuta epithymum]|uniref:Calmodulin-binding domain-containing protein n=1 Tax=Cuscuta epithymum TaxID=186058 RepID=A0AAV0DAF5_9ASTE|nr:unnamed protein product [Cuscuta epithymum]
MAEDIANSSLTSETLVKNELERTSPIISSNKETGHLSTKHSVFAPGSLSSRRSSTGKQNCRSDSDHTIVPNYLRASTGSCHDFCKYGRNHSSEPKPIRPLLRRPKKPLNQKLIPAMASGTSVSGACDPEETHSQAPPEIIKDVVFLQPEEVDPSPVQDTSSNKMTPKTEGKTKSMSPKDHPSKSLKQPSSCKPLEGVKPGSGGKGDIISCERVRDTKHSRKIVVKAPTASSTSKPSVREALNLRKRVSLTLKPAKTHNRMGETDVEAEEKVSEKTLHVVQMENVDPAQDDEIVASLSSPSSLLLPESSSASHSPDSYIESNPSKTLTKSKKPVLPKLDDAPPSVKPKFSRGKIRDTANENNSPKRLKYSKEKILSKKREDANVEVVKDNMTESDHHNHIISSSENRDGKNIPASTKGAKSMGRNQIMASKRGTLIATRVETPLPVTLKFRKGTVVNLHQDINSPRILNFRKGRILRKKREDGNVEVVKDNMMESVHHDRIISSSEKGDNKNISASSKGAKSVGRNQSIASRRGTLIATRVETSLPVKLKFRRGTVVNLRQEINSPRRLNFRKGKILRENQESNSDGGKDKAVESVHEQDDTDRSGVATSKGGDDKKIGANSKEVSPQHETKRSGSAKVGRDSRGNQVNKSGDARRRSSKKRVEGGENSSDMMGPGKVILRHHEEVEGVKKDGQGVLLNNVIEETASKLVESKKSKVKALVGAFETVISLQEKKPSSDHSIS